MKVHYISPYRTDKNIGRAINEAIANLNASSDDWVVHTDQDVLWLLSDSKSQLEEILSTTQYRILAPRMNRLGNDYQLVTGIFDVTDIKQHIALADQMSRENRGVVSSFAAGPLAAACLCFQVKTWRSVGGFAQRSLAFDTQFCSRVQRLGFQMGIMEGIYVWHSYRIGKEISDISHLL